MNIKLETNIDLFYVQLLELFSSFEPIRGLRKGDRLVLAEIMKQHYIYRDVKKDHLRRNVVFSQEIREEMCNNLGITRYSFNNSISAIRKAGILDKNNNLIKKLNIIPNGEFKFELTFVINEEKTETP